ncbi:hypothetical protein CSC73_12785 [Pseudoxanthomonas sacheonensis]|nr:hypothetical protein CSC73_12785 [Pseudoxanthomonas sacheonensis]
MLFSWNGPSSEKTHENVYLGGSLVATIDHDWPSNAVIATKYQHTDALGSPVAVTNEAGTVIDRTNYEPYGAAINKPAYEGIGYTGHVMDGATGLTYMQQRYYDPVCGCFLSVDPVTAYDTGDMRHFNVYAYAYNNPYTFDDPDGRKGKIGWAVELGTTAMRKISRVTLEQAVKIRRSGGNFLGDSTRISRRVETTAHGRANRIRHDGHELKDESGKVAGKGLPHYQTDGVSGHSFVDKAGDIAFAGLAFGAMQLENNADIADKVAEVADLFDPYMIGEAGGGSDCAEGCGLPRANGGEQGPSGRGDRDDRKEPVPEPKRKEEIK